MWTTVNHHGYQESENGKASMDRSPEDSIENTSIRMGRWIRRLVYAMKMLHRNTRFVESDHGQNSSRIR